MNLYDFLHICARIAVNLIHDITFANCVGTVAGILSTLAFFPQAIKVWRTKSTQDLSLAMYALYNSALVVWVIYGFMIDAWPLILTEAFTLVLSLYILIMKLLEK